MVKEKGMLGISLEKTIRDDALFGLPVESSQDLTIVASVPYLPSTWAFDSMKALLYGNITEGMFQFALSWSFSGVMVFMVIIIAEAIYFKGLSKTRTVQARLFNYRSPNSFF